MTETALGSGTHRNRGISFSLIKIVCVLTACAVLAVGGFAVASFHDGGHTSARQIAVKNATFGRAENGTFRPAAVPKATVHVPASRRPGAAPSEPAASSPAGNGSATCPKPSFVTSAPQGMWHQDPYFVFNEMGVTHGAIVTQALYACSYSNWYVVANISNDNGNRAVKSYPNSHRDFSDEPTITSLHSVTSTFAETSPGTGIYEDAYDIWLNGIAGPDSTEVMIWTENHGQVPYGVVRGTATIDGRSWTVWKSQGNHIAFVASSNFTSGTMNLLAFFQWTMAQGWIPRTTTLGQVDYGVEVVTTNGVPAVFSFSDFSVNAS